MASQWWTIVGLTFDILGFGFLAWEWSRGFREEWRERHKGDALLGRSFPSGNRNNSELTKTRQALTDREMSARAWRFGFGALMIVLGFVLQLVGSALAL